MVNNLLLVYMVFCKLKDMEGRKRSSFKHRNFILNTHEFHTTTKNNINAVTLPVQFELL